MEQGFWGKLKKPFFVLAPMADVTDAAFRRIIAKYGKPDALWTEFVSADGLFMADENGKEKIKRALLYSEAERPIVAQFFSSNPRAMYEAAVYAVKAGFDGFDINMGCPDRSIEKQGAGAALMKNPKCVRELIQAVQEGIQSTGKNIPISVKTRTGYASSILDEWLPALLETKLAAITIHARTRKDMSKVPARWDEIARAVSIRNELKSETLIIGNGDVTDLDDAQSKAKEYGCDGVMLGRAIFGNPWLFNENKKEVSIKERLEVMVEHTKLYEELFGDIKSFNIMKKHYKAYVNGWDGAKELRVKLMDAKDACEVEDITSMYLKG